MPHRARTSVEDGPIVSGFSEEVCFEADSADDPEHLSIDASGHLQDGTDGNGAQTIVTGRSVVDGTWRLAVATTSPPAGSVLDLDAAAAGSDPTMTAGEPFSGCWGVGEGELTDSPDDPERRYLAGPLRFTGADPSVLSADEVAPAPSIGRRPAPTGGTGPIRTARSAPASPTASTSPAPQVPVTEDDGVAATSDPQRRPDVSATG